MLLDYQLTFKKSSLSSVLKLFKDNSVYKVVDLSKEQKVIKNYWIFNTKSDSYYKS